MSLIQTIFWTGIVMLMFSVYDVSNWDGRFCSVNPDSLDRACVMWVDSGLENISNKILWIDLSTKKWEDESPTDTR